MRNVLTLWHCRASNERHYLYMLSYAHTRREARHLAQPFFTAHPAFPEHRLKPLPYGFPSPTLWWMPGQMTEDGRNVTPWVPAFERLDPTIFEGCLHEEASVRLTILNQAQFALFSSEDWGESKLIERRAARMVMRQLAWFKENAIALNYIHFWTFDRDKYDLVTRRPNCTYLAGGEGGDV